MIIAETKRRRARRACLAAAIMLNGSMAAADGFHVAVNGGDANPGTREMPFATLERARDAVRDLKKKGLPGGGATVWIHGGTHERASAFALGPEDAGTADAPIVYRAVPGEVARISGGRRIPGGAFKPVIDETVLARLDAAARGQVLEADLRALGIAEFGEMKVRGFGMPWWNPVLNSFSTTAR